MGAIETEREREKQWRRKTGHESEERDGDVERRERVGEMEQEIRN